MIPPLAYRLPVARELLDGWRRGHLLLSDDLPRFEAADRFGESWLDVQVEQDLLEVGRWVTWDGFWFREEMEIK